MGDRRCCCVRACDLGEDDFNRADAETLGPKWMEPISGEWHIENNEAVEQTGTGRVSFAKRHPVPAPSGAVYLDAVSPQHGDVYELLINGDEDGNNYHLARFTIEGEEVLISLYRVTGAGETLLEEEHTVGWTGTRFRMHAIISRTEFCAGMDAAVLSLVWYTMPDLFVDGYYAGMGVDGQAKIAVDDFEFYQHLETFTGCPFCICHCETNPMPPVLLAIIVDATGRMIDFEGCELLLSWDRVISNWQQDPAARCTCGIEKIDLGMILHCDHVHHKLEDIGLEIGRACHDTAKGPSHVFNPLIPPSTCDPLFLRFGPIEISGSDLACCFEELGVGGEYYVEVTEHP